MHKIIQHTWVSALSGIHQCTSSKIPRHLSLTWCYYEQPRFWLSSIYFRHVRFIYSGPPQKPPPFCYCRLMTSVLPQASEFIPPTTPSEVPIIWIRYTDLGILPIHKHDSYIETQSQHETSSAQSLKNVTQLFFTSNLTLRISALKPLSGDKERWTRLYRFSYMCNFFYLHLDWTQKLCPLLF